MDVASEDRVSRKEIFAVKLVLRTGDLYGFFL